MLAKQESPSLIGFSGLFKKICTCVFSRKNVYNLEKFKRGAKISIPYGEAI